MKVHLVLAHPVADSLNAGLAARVEQTLLAAGASLDRLDLYAEGFDPRLGADERARYTAAGTAPGEDIGALQARLGAADLLVLVFPTWWSAPPAILKGWFDRVWTPGFAFDPVTPIRPRLTGLKSVLVVTTFGAPWWIDLLVMWRPVWRMLRVALVGACAPQARFRMLSLYAAETVTPERLDRFGARLDKAVNEAVSLPR